MKQLNRWKALVLAALLPLLIAALTRHTPPPLLADRLSAGFDALTTTLRDAPPRQRGLRVVFDMSWRALTPALQERLARLAAFRGGFSPAAAQAVARMTASASWARPRSW